MKLRVRINRQTSRVELSGEEPTLQELSNLIKQTLLSCHGLSADADFSLSLNGSELLSDSGQTLSSCGIVSGDLICVMLPQTAAASVVTSEPNTSSKSSTAQTSSQDVDSRVAQQSSRSAALTQLGSDAAPPVWEPMLCGEASDGQAPLSLELLFHSAQIRSPNDAVMVAAHLLMLETGFGPQGSEVKSGEMPPGWRSAGGVYKLQYTHPLCESSLASVVALEMGPLLIINATLKVTESVNTVQKLQLKASSYVTDEWPGGSAAAALRGLKKLSRSIKDQLAYPLIAAAREAMALPVAFGLPALPPELLLRVLRLLDVRSLLRLSQVSRHFQAAASDSTLWRHLFRRDFTDADHSRSRDTDWKELYKKSHRLRSELRRAPRHHSMPPFPLHNIIPPMPRPLFPPLPGIIGGEYDQRPSLPRDLLPRPRHDPIRPFEPVGGPRWGPGRQTGGRASDARRGFI